METTVGACQAIWLQDLKSEIMNNAPEKVVIPINNKYITELTRNHVFHGRSKFIQTRYHFIRKGDENEQVEVEYVPVEEQEKANILTKPLA